MKPKIEYRGARRNATRGQKKHTLEYPTLVTEHKAYTRGFAVDLAKNMLNYTSDFSHIKKITGLSIRKMVQLELIEWYHPFKKKIPNPNATKISDAFLEVPDTSISWLRRKWYG